MEKIGYATKSNLPLLDGVNDYCRLKDGLGKIEYGLRDVVEDNEALIQPIAVAVIISEDGKSVLCVKKNKNSTREDSPEFGNTLFYGGGHMRKEDTDVKKPGFLETLRNTLILVVVLMIPI